MNRAVAFLQDARIFYLATDDNGQPKVRPFGAVLEYADRVYFCTNNQKAVFRQMVANPRVEICACNAEGGWIRITGEAVIDDNDAARAAMLAAMPGLGRMYTLGDGLFEVFYLANATATINARGSAPETFSL